MSTQAPRRHIRLLALPVILGVLLGAQILDAGAQETVQPYQQPTPTPSASATSTPTPTSTGTTQVLTVTKSGSGGGLVSSSPAGIDCGTDCAESYPNGTTVYLAADPDSGSDFLGWGEPCTEMTGLCVVTMDHAQTVDARFGPRRVNARVFHDFRVSDQGTKVRGLFMFNLSRSDELKLACDGDGCAFRRRTPKRGGARGSNRDLKGFFEGRRLKPGTTITIRVTAPGAIGKQWQFEMRRTREPRRIVKCLPPGGGRPTRC